MLFIFLLDNGESMNQVKFPSLTNDKTSDNNDSFLPTAMDASIYFIQQYCKLVYDNFSTSRTVDEEFSSVQKEKDQRAARNFAAEHRFILLTFNEAEQLQLKHTWKDSYSSLQDELKNISFENRAAFPNEKDLNTNQEGFIQGIAGQFEEFMEKFEVSYFNCTHLTGGHFILKESENVFLFCLTDEKSKLNEFHANLRLGWQRKNVFIQLHPESYKDLCASQSSSSTISQDYNFFPVTNLRDSDQLARTLCHANIRNSLETPNMETIGKGGLVDFVSEEFGFKSLGLLRPNFAGKPKWPVPNTLTETSWSDYKPKITVTLVESVDVLKFIQFDEYITFAPVAYYALKQANCKTFLLSVECQLGSIPFGFGELIEPISENSSSNLLKTFIGPFNFVQLDMVIDGKDSFTKYLQNIPQYYEYFIHNCLGEAKWTELCKSSYSRTWRNEFPLPAGLIESKNNFKTSWRLKSKNDLTLLVERAENSHKLRTMRRQSSYHPFVFPSLSQLKNDSEYLSRLESRFKNSLQVFLASCDPQMGCSNTFSQFQLPQVLFKHSLSVHQMTDFSEAMQKKRCLRPLFNENERDLFHILKEMPVLQEEMAATNFVSGDIFGNPYKKEHKTKGKSRMALKRASQLPAIQDESESIVTDDSDVEEASEGVQDADLLMSPMSIDEIDYKEMEDIETEIISDGSIVNLPINQAAADADDAEVILVEEHYADLKMVEKWIKSPGGLEAKTKLIETLPVIRNMTDLNSLFELSKRFKRIGLSKLISERIDKIKAV